MLSHSKDIYTKEILFHSHDYYEIYFLRTAALSITLKMKATS